MVDSRLAQTVQSLHEFAEKHPRTHIHHDGQSVHPFPAGSHHPGQGRQPARGQIIHHVPVQVLENLGGLGASRPAHPSDDEHLGAFHLWQGGSIVQLRDTGRYGGCWIGHGSTLSAPPRLCAPKREVRGEDGGCGSSQSSTPARTGFSFLWFRPVPATGFRALLEQVFGLGAPGSVEPDANSPLHQRVPALG